MSLIAKLQLNYRFEAGNVGTRAELAIIAKHIIVSSRNLRRYRPKLALRRSDKTSIAIVALAV